MRLRPLGSGSANAWSPAEAPAEAPAPRIRRMDFAGVSERDKDGVPTRLGLPGRVAGRQVPLYVDGRWAAAVGAGGKVLFDFRDGTAPRPEELAKIKPGTRIVCAIDRDGNILSLMAPGNVRSLK